MTRLISVITPSYRPVPEQLKEAYESLRMQEVPQGWAWEWVIQEDGDTGAARDILPEDPRIVFGTGRRGGVAITRNLALARSRGELVKNLDQDDILTPGVIARDINVLAADPLIQWTTSRVLDLLPDGSTVGFDNDPPVGRLEPGVVLNHWLAHNYRLPVHPTTICIRRTLAVALGGWMAVPGSDDTGLLTAASVVSLGYFHQEVGLLYRKWPGQATASVAHTEPAEWNLRMSLIRERAESLAKTWQGQGARGRVASGLQPRNDHPPPTQPWCQ
jgi:glycosyltransferase involved in cell wall biosynthesis